MEVKETKLEEIMDKDNKTQQQNSNDDGRSSPTLPEENSKENEEPMNNSESSKENNGTSEVPEYGYNPGEWGDMTEERRRRKKSELEHGTPFKCEKTTPWYKEEVITDEEKKFHDQIRSFNPTVEQQFKLAAPKVLGDVENLLNSAFLTIWKGLKKLTGRLWKLLRS